MSVTVGLVIDTSGSMSNNGYVANTVIDSKAFVSMALQPGDQFTVVQYSTSGANVYPATGTSLATVDAQLTVPAAAATAIQNLTFDGWSTNITNANGGVPFAASFISSTDDAALVLLTDGYQNDGSNPPALPSYPVYVCGMGANVDTTFLQNIATQTGGTYYTIPYVSTMMQIYNEIRGNATTFANVQLIANQLQPCPPLNFLYLPVTVDDTATVAEFAVTWDNPSYTYTSSAQPTGNQVSITLVDPSGNVVATTPVVIGEGYVVFQVSSPATGGWNTQIEYAGATGGPAIHFTVGVFSFASAASAVTLLVEQEPAAGGGAKLIARAMQHGKPLPGVRVEAETVTPTVSEKEALERHRDALQSLDVPPDGKLTDSAKLNILHQKLFPETDIFGHRRSLVRFAPQEHGRHAASIPPRSHVVVKATGKTASGVPFERTRVVSVV